MSGKSTTTVYGKLIFDIGANAGNKTAKYLQHADKVICFEPQQQLVKDLERRFETEIKKNRVVVLGCALGPTNTSMKLYPADCNTLATMSREFQSGRFKQQGYTWYDPIDVTVRPVKEFIDTYGVPDYMKIDVEGFEWSVLQGLGDKLPRVISFEYCEEFPTEYTKILQYLYQKGYRYYNVSLGESDVFACDWCNFEKLLYFLNKIHVGRFSWGDIYAALDIST